MGLKILSITRDKTFIEYEQEIKGQKANDTETRVTHEAPLPAFDKALQKLTTVVCYILGTGQQWGDEVVVRGLSLSYTVKGTRSAQITFARTLSATGKDHPMKTPVFQFDEPADGEDDERECSGKHAELIDAMLEHAEAYIKGDRAQAILAFEKPAKKPAKDKNQAELPGVED